MQGENGDLKNRGLKVEINHVGGPLGGPERASSDFPDSSIGEGMDITIQGANGHVKHKNGGTAAAAAALDGASLVSNDSGRQQQDNQLQLPGLDDEKLGYSSDMSIGRGMDISIRGDGDKECLEDGGAGGQDGWGDANGKEAGTAGTYYDSKEKIDYDDEKKPIDDDDDDGTISYDDVDGKNVDEVLFDPVDDVVVERCCPDVCYNVCPCCIGDPDSPFWQLWYRHRLQVSR